MCVFSADFVRKHFLQFACGHSKGFESECVFMWRLSEYRELNALLHVGQTNDFFIETTSVLYSSRSDGICEIVRLTRSSWDTESLSSVPF